MKQEVFAAAMGVSRTTVSNIECGRQRVFLDQVYRAASILGLPVADLLPPLDPSLASTPRILTPQDDPIPGQAMEKIAETIAAVSSERSPSNGRSPRRR
jgi:transcriptional regulator with XRE-family HTH domain